VVKVENGRKYLKVRRDLKAECEREKTEKMAHL